jgi:hypothetical protein
MSKEDWVDFLLWPFRSLVVVFLAIKIAILVFRLDRAHKKFTKLKAENELLLQSTQKTKGENGT